MARQPRQYPSLLGRARPRTPDGQRLGVFKQGRPGRVRGGLWLENEDQRLLEVARFSMYHYDAPPSVDHH